MCTQFYFIFLTTVWMVARWILNGHRFKNCKLSARHGFYWWAELYFFQLLGPSLQSKTQTRAMMVNVVVNMVVSMITIKVHWVGGITPWEFFMLMVNGHTATSLHVIYYLTIKAKSMYSPIRLQESNWYLSILLIYLKPVYTLCVCVFATWSHSMEDSSETTATMLECFWKFTLHRKWHDRDWESSAGVIPRGKSIRSLGSFWHRYSIAVLSECAHAML